MAKGEKRWSGSGDSVKRTFTPVPSQDWEVKLVTDAAEIAAGSKEKGSIPFIKGVRFVCFGSATVEGGKDSLIFQNFFLSLKEGKDGNVMPDYANQLKGLMKALGDIRDMDSASKTVNEEGDTVEYLKPKEVLAYLKEHNGETLKLHSKIENDAVYGKKAVVDYFIEAEEGEASAPVDEDEEVAEDETEEAEEETEAEVEEDEEPTPIKKKTVAKAAPVQLKKKAR